MSTLSLVAPNYRETAGVITVFDYDTQPLAEIRAVLLQAYGTKYGSPDLVEKKRCSLQGRRATRKYVAYCMDRRQSRGLYPPYCTSTVEDGSEEQPI